MFRCGHYFKKECGTGKKEASSRRTSLDFPRIWVTVPLDMLVMVSGCLSYPARTSEELMNQGNFWKALVRGSGRHPARDPESWDAGR